MPKIKCFKNPLKSAKGYASSSTTPAPRALSDASTNHLQVHEVQQQQAAHALLQQEQVSIPRQQEQALIFLQQEQASILPSNSSATLVHRRSSPKYWRVDTEDIYILYSKKVIKQINVKVNEVNYLPVRERIIMNFDDYDAAHGDAQGLLSSYCGSLTIVCNLFSISFEKWLGPSGMPRKYMEDCFETILKELRRRNKKIQRKQKMPHTGGSKANSRRRYELFLEIGKAPSRGQMFIETHKRKNGSFVNDEAWTIAERIELHMTQCNINELEVSPGDIIGKMLGEEHSKRVRCMVMGAALSNTFVNIKR
ncbi:hypothetical protein P3S67_004896 [Capsicum chacoense]